MQALFVENCDRTLSIGRALWRKTVEFLAHETFGNKKQATIFWLLVWKIADHFLSDK